MIAFGRVQAALLFEGDILGIYGATGLVLLLLMNRRPRVLVAWATVSLVLLLLMNRRPRVLVAWATVSLVLLGVLYALVALAPDAPAAPSDYLASVVERLVWLNSSTGAPASVPGDSPEHAPTASATAADSTRCTARVFIPPLSTMGGGYRGSPKRFGWTAIGAAKPAADAYGSGGQSSCAISFAFHASRSDCWNRTPAPR